MTRPVSSASPYDVIVVGSGAAGGMAAYALTLGGARVCLLEAGREYDPQTETPMFAANFEAPLKGARTPDKPFGYYDATVGGGWDVPGEPYTVAEGSAFRWYRARMLGGRTNHWGRLSLRYAAHDLVGRSIDGYGVDWPIAYDDLSHWYDRAERLVGIVGRNDGLDDAPDSPPGVLQPPPAPRAHELLVMAGGRKLGRPVVANRAAVIVEPIDGRSACIYATPCSRGCALGANFQSTTVLLPPARKTGRLTTLTGARVTEVSLDASGRADGVHYFDTRTRTHHFVAGRSVMLGAGALESVRILMNSRGPGHADGIGAGSGLLGRCIMDTAGSNLYGQFPKLENLPPYDDFGIWFPHIYIPWWGLKEQRGGKLGFPRGYHIEVSGGRQEPGAETFSRMSAVAPGRWGAALKADARRYFGTFVRFAQRGETLPNPDNRLELDPFVKDDAGTPAVKIHYRWSAHEFAQTVHAQKSAAEFIEASGGKVLGRPATNGATAILPGGEVIHEVGGARMGADPRSSVTDPHGRVWGVENLYVTDGATFATSPHKNPTLTILALAWRASDHLLRASAFRV